MKKFFALLFVLPLFVACEKDPDDSKLDYDFVVYTSYDKDAKFSDHKTYYVPDSVLLITDKEKAEYLTGSEGDKIIDAIVDQMNSRGFTRVTDKESADLGIQTSFVQNAYYFYGYNGSSNWWGSYPGYWGPGYWGGGWNSWYYPYPITYSYQVGALLSEIVDLKGAVTRTDDKLPVLWTAYMTGLLSNSNKINTQLSVQAVNQAFEQSPYITTK